MPGNAFLLNDIAEELDALFSVRALDEDPIKRWIDQVYNSIGYDHIRIFEDDFCRRGNGLMLRSGENIGRVYCAAFPAPQVLEELLATAEGPSLLFLHHPIDMEVGGEGFLPIQSGTIAQMKAAGVSVYACHAPMDCHEQIGTNASIVEAFGIRVERNFSKYGNGFAARFGEIAPLTLDGLLARGKEIFGVDRAEIGGGRPETITRLAVVAGGGDDLKDLRDAERLGAQAYLTGEWHPRLTSLDKEKQSWFREHNARCQTFASQTKMALLSFSHAASEFLVMKTQMKNYFEKRGLPVTCLAQSNWWR